MHIIMGIAEVMHFTKSLFQIHENLEVTASMMEHVCECLLCCLNVHRFAQCWPLS